MMSASRRTSPAAREPRYAYIGPAEAVLLCECERCQHFRGYNTGETKIGCVYEMVEET
jgi:hypothetical protein